MRLAIVGSRTVKSADLDAIIKTMHELVVSGGAAGADTMGEAWAKRHGI
jgi:predicted Rossmann fold nucleotide-binding protein DprA/Smf involved in DNA uptake